MSDEFALFSLNGLNFTEFLFLFVICHCLTVCVAFKKVTWPPAGYEEEPDIAPPPSQQLMDKIPLNDTAMKINKDYKLLPGVYAEEPAELPEDVWPPPEPISKFK